MESGRLTQTEKTESENMTQAEKLQKIHQTLKHIEPENMTQAELEIWNLVSKQTANAKTRRKAKANSDRILN